jgi:hypothetical protein
MKLSRFHHLAILILLLSASDGLLSHADDPVRPMAEVPPHDSPILYGIRTISYS